MALTHDNYETLYPFKAWVQQNLPAVYDDSLSYTDLLAKLLSYVNSLTDNNNKFSKDIVNAINYINEYFNSTDFTENVNRKLDEMANDGTLSNLLQPLFDAYKTQIDGEISNQNTRINDIQNELDGKVSNQNSKINDIQTQQTVLSNRMDTFTSLPDGSTAGNAELEDIRNWFNGDKSSSAGDAVRGQANLLNSNLNYLPIVSLDQYLQNNFNTLFSKDINKGPSFQGYCTGDKGGQIQIRQDAGYKYSIINLDYNTTYIFNGMNRYLVRSILIVDGTNKIVDTAPSAVVGGDTQDNWIFKVTKIGLKAYISEQIFDTTNGGVYTEFSDSTRIRKLVGTFTNNLLNNVAQNISNIENMGVTSTNLNEVITLQHFDGYTQKVYSLEKGVTYKIGAYQSYLIQGISITDGNYKLIYTSHDGGDRKYVEKVYTPSQNCFLFVPHYREDEPPTVLVQNVSPNEKTNWPSLKGLKIVYDGDSITESRLEGPNANGGSYPKIIADIVNGTYHNYSEGGATITMKSGQTTHSIVNSLSNITKDGDCYVFSGGVNDLWDNRPLGELTSDYTSEVDITTVTGALENIFRYALSNFVGKPILFVITHKLMDPFFTGNGYNQFKLHDRIIEVCNKYSIPYYDAFNESGLNGWNVVQRNMFINANPTQTGDGTHPNETGFKKYYVPQLLNILNSIVENK